MALNWGPQEKEQEDFLLKRTAKGYFGASSVHGLSYIAEAGRHYTER